MSQAGVPRTVYLDLSGKGNYVNVTRVDDYGKWGCMLYPNPESIDKIKKMKEGWFEGVEGIKNELKLDENGEYMRFGRKQKHETRTKTMVFPPPLLLDKDGKTPLQNTLVGNGSDITITIELYFFKKPNKGLGSATRLQAIRVDNLIPYEGARDMSQSDLNAVGGMEKAPVPQW